MTEDPTQRIRVNPDERSGYASNAPTTAMPGPLNLAGSPVAAAGDSSSTDVLSLDELFDAQPTAETEPPGPTPPVTEPAPTWTAMPVVPVRSEPLTPVAQPAPPAPAPAPARSGPPLGDRMRSDAAAAWDDTVRRTRAWFARDDNALMLLTVLVAVFLMLAVAALHP